MGIINLDHIASNPLLPEVKKAMIAAIEADYHNPSSQHSAGEQAAAELERARASVAALIGCESPKEVVFTSGGTEAVNHAVKGTVLANARKGDHIVTSNIEHNAVIRSLKRLQGQGFKVTSLDVDHHGRVSPQAVADALTDRTVLVSIMHSNNETGTIQPIEAIAGITRERQILLHTDAVDSVGVVPIDVRKLGVDLMSFGANTFGGPTGVGGLYIRRGTPIWPLLEGGVQEHNKRAGTENLIGIIGMGVAAERVRRDLPERLKRLTGLKKQLLEGLERTIDDIIVNTPAEDSLPNLVSVSLRYIEGESVMLMLDDDGIAVATRSACATGSLRASHVLLSIGRSHADAQGTLVLTLGPDNTADEIDRFLVSLQKVVRTLRAISPLYQKSRQATGR